MREESGGGKETAETAPSQQSDLLRSLGGKGHLGAILPITATIASTWVSSL